MVTSARLDVNFYMFDSRYPGVPTQIGAFEVLRPWAEYEATWRRPVTGLSWTGCDGVVDRSSVPAASTVVDATGWHMWQDVGLTQLVQKWVSDPSANNGVVLIGQSPTERQFWLATSSQNPTTASRPKLWVVFYRPSPTATPTETATVEPTATLTPEPTATETATAIATETATVEPTIEPTATAENTVEPTATSTVEPTNTPEATVEPTAELPGGDDGVQDGADTPSAETEQEVELHNWIMSDSLRAKRYGTLLHDLEVKYKSLEYIEKQIGYFRETIARGVRLHRMVNHIARSAEMVAKSKGYQVPIAAVPYTHLTLPTHSPV